MRRSIVPHTNLLAPRRLPVVLLTAAVSACSSQGLPKDDGSLSQAAGPGTNIAPGSGGEGALAAGAEPSSGATGRILAERWDGLPGEGLAALTASERYPARPTHRFYLSRLATSPNQGDAYGVRIRGYVTPTRSGPYRFLVAGDNEVRLFVSTDEDPGHVSSTPTAFLAVGQWTGSSTFDAYPGQRSEPVSLVAGRRYYLEVLQKEGTGGDGVAVGWEGPGGNLEAPLPSTYLSPYEPETRADAPDPNPATVLRSLATGHPRLVGSAPSFEKLRRSLPTDATLAAYLRSVEGVDDKGPAVDATRRQKCDRETGGNRTAKRILALPPCTRIKQDDVRILDTSREVLTRVSHLSLAYQLTGNKAYARRGIEEMLAVTDAAWGDWNPIHFLDTAELTHAVAIGYDWLYAEMTAAERTTVRAGLVSKGLRPGLAAFEKNAHWVDVDSNWNLVCNGGLITGALAIADEEPEVASKILAGAVASARKSGSLRAFGPDGAYGEGIVYWGYATAFLTAMLSSLETALGTDFGLGAAEGLAEAGTFPLYMIGPKGRLFNYADVGDGWSVRTPTMHYLAWRYGRPAYATYAKDALSDFAVLWRNADAPDVDLATFPLSRSFRKAEVGVLRSGVGDNDAYVGFKSGSNLAGHSHLDLGSFVYDANGSRWAVDLGAEEYGPVGRAYFDATTRWNFYRTRAEGQNTLVLNPSIAPDQDPSAGATIESFTTTGARTQTVTTLTAAYAGAGARSVRRGVALDAARKSLLVQDEVATTRPSELYWFMHTRAEVALAGETATLTQGTERVTARILSPKGASFTVRDAVGLPTSPPRQAGETVNTGTRKLTVRLTDVTETRIVVELVPLSAGQTLPAAPAVVPLADW